MGCYTKKQLPSDFDIATKGFKCKNTSAIKSLAIKILNESPENKCRDFAISHLLQAAEKLSMCLLKEMDNETKY